MDDILSNADVRRQQAYRRVATQTPQCVTCDETDPRCLEEHHIAGQAHHDQAVPVCRNCHRKLSDAQRDHPEALDASNPYLEMVGHFLLGVADLLQLLAETLIEFGKGLVDLSRTSIDGAAS